MRYITFDKIKTGMVLSHDILDKDQRVLLTEGMVLKREHIKRLQDFGIHGIYIDDDWSKGIELDEVIPEALQNKARDALEHLDIDKIEECASTIVDFLSTSKTLCHDFETLRKYDEYTYQHSINVAILATELGIGMECTMKQLCDLAMGGLLHDIGKKNIPIDIINKKGKLTDEEYAIVKKHPEDGYKMVYDNSQISSCVRQIIYQHHENFDGTGYPRYLSEDRIYHLAMLVHVCDVYDALISKRSYKDSFPIKDVIEIINNGRKSMFDNDVVTQFFKYVPIYHKGSEIILDDNRMALVYENHRGDMLHPSVKLKNGKIIDLRYSKHWIAS